MPLTAIVVSKDRAAQLDLLLRSVTCHADNLVDSISVVWDASDEDFERAYLACESEHPSVDFFPENTFFDEISYLVEQADDHVMFLTDDSYFYRDLPELDPLAVLQAESDVLCFSLRLGRNTWICYPLKGRDQRVPHFINMDDHLIWGWAESDGDFGYPGSLDGHIFRKADMLRLIREDDHWWNPNTLEDTLTRGVYKIPKSSMASFPRSVLVGIPANRTSRSHPGNRYGDFHPIDQTWLNDEYLAGRHIQFPNIHIDAVNAAHQELDLETA